MILGGIGPAQETPRTVDLLDAGVMSGGHGVEAENVSALEESIELEMTVALDARIGCDPAGVIGEAARNSKLPVSRSWTTTPEVSNAAIIIRITAMSPGTKNCRLSRFGL